MLCCIGYANCGILINIVWCLRRWRWIGKQNKIEILEPDPLSKKMLWSMVALQSNGRKMVFSINMTRSFECLFEKIYHGTYSNHWASPMALVVRTHLPMQEMQEMWVQSLGREDPLEKEMANHSRILAWRIPRTEEPWWATVHRLTKSQTWLKRLNIQMHTLTINKISSRKIETFGRFLKWRVVLVPSSLCSQPAICLWKNFSQRISLIREVKTRRNKGKWPPPLTSGPALSSDHENVVERTPHVFWDYIWRSLGAFTFLSEVLSHQVRTCLHCWWDHMGHVRGAGSAEREAVSTSQGSLRRPLPQLPPDCSHMRDLPWKPPTTFSQL